MIVDLTKNSLEREIEDRIWLSDPVELAKALVLAKKLFSWNYEHIRDHLIAMHLRELTRTNFFSDFLEKNT